MLDSAQVFGAVAKMLKEQTPALYINRATQDFVRPSLRLEQGEETREDLCLAFVETTSRLVITCYASEGGNDSDRQELADMQRQVINLFLLGYIRVGNRAVKCTASGSGTSPGTAWVDVTLKWTEDRSPTASAPVMGGLALTTTIT